MPIPLGAGLGFVFDKTSLAVDIDRVVSVIRQVEVKLPSQFPEVIASWMKYFNRNLPEPIKAVTHTRTGKLASRMALVMKTRGGQNRATVLTMTSTDKDVARYGPVQETGRIEGSGPGHIVPLASWLKYKGKKSATMADFKRDISQPGAMTSKGKPLAFNINTVSGPAKIFLFKRRSVSQGKKTSLHHGKAGGTVVRKALLKDKAIGMYLYYKTQRGVFGKSKDFRKTAPALKMPIAVGLMNQLGSIGGGDAPQWFSRATARFLPKLLDAIINLNSKANNSSSDPLGAVIASLKERVGH